MGRNTALMYFRLAVTAIADFIAVRIELQALGAEAFGTYSALVSTVGMVTFFSGALQGAARRFLSVELGRDGGNPRRCLMEIVSVTFLLLVIVVFALLPIGIVMIPVKCSTELFVVLAMMTMVRFVLLPFETLIAVESRFAFLAAFSIVQGVFSLAVAGVVWMCPSLVAFGLAKFVSATVVLMCYGCYCNRHFTYFTLHPGFLREAIRDVGSFFSWSALGSVAGLLKRAGIIIVINLLVGATANAAYESACRIGSVIWMLTDAFRTVYYPKIGFAWGAGDGRTFRQMTFTAFRCSLLGFGLLCGLIFAFAPQILSVWLKDVPVGTVAFVRCMAVRYFFEALSTPFDSAVLVRGRIARYQIVLTVLLGSSCPLAYLFLALGCPVWTAEGAVALVTFISFWYRLWMMRSPGTPSS